MVLHSTRAVTETAEKQLAAETSRLIREKRTIAYTQYIASVRDVDESLSDINGIGYWYGEGPSIRERSQRLDRALDVYNERYNDISVYGTDGAWAIAEHINEAVHVRTVSAKYGSIKPVQKWLHEVPEGCFENQIRQFRNLMCRELSPAPRPGCFESGPSVTAPTEPSNLRVTGTASSSVSLAWNASTDNMIVVGYDIYSGTRGLAVNVPRTSVTIEGLAPDTTYTLTVRAKDAAGNVSPPSNQVTARTRPGKSG